MLLGHSSAGVDHLEPHPGRHVVAGQQTRDQPNFSHFRELDGVAHQIDEYLAQAGGVGADRFGDRAGVLCLQGDVLCLGPDPRQRGDIGHDLDRRTCNLLDFDLPGLDLGEVEDVVDDFQQVLAVSLYRVNRLDVVRFLDPAEQQVREAEDGSHWGADLVAHVGQEFTLGPRGGFGRDLGLFQRLVSPDKLTLYASQIEPRKYAKQPADNNAG